MCTNLLLTVVGRAGLTGCPTVRDRHGAPVFTSNALMIGPTRRTMHRGAVALAIVLLAVSAQAQTAPDDVRVTLALTGGASVGHETGGTLGGEGTVRVARAIDVVVAGAHLWNITPAGVASRAETIATAVGATTTATVRAGVFDVGVRVRWPIAARVQAYALAGAGIAHVRTETTFARGGATTPPDALGIQLGRDLAGATTKPTLLLGGGAVVALPRRGFLDLGIRYDRIFARPSEIPNDVGVNVVRLQLGAGVRF